jgi:hypothetical protein
MVINYKTPIDIAIDFKRKVAKNSKIILDCYILFAARINNLFVGILWIF